MTRLKRHPLIRRHMAAFAPSEAAFVVFRRNR